LFLEDQIMKTAMKRSMVLAAGIMALWLARAEGAEGVDTNDPRLPPNVGVYMTAEQIHATYSGLGLTIVLQQIQHRPFAGSAILNPVGPDEVEHFVSDLNGMVSVSGAVILPPTALQMSGPVDTIVHGKVGNVTGTFQTEMLSMDLSGTTPFGAVMVRESPTLPSLGNTSITDIGGGNFHIDSFFDVFTELSIDGGQTWIPQSDGPTHVVLCVPEPGCMSLLGLGGLLLVRRRKD
jgi:hypothetical protein